MNDEPRIVIWGPYLSRAAVALVVLATAMLGWGAWRANTHASVWLNVNDHAGRTPNLLWSGVTEGRVAFRDPSGRLLAEAVDCRPQLDSDAWRSCFERQSRWTARWAPRAHDARVTVGGCIVDRVPVLRRSSTDWWLWWVPLPHVGGTPSGYHTLDLHLDSARCAPATAP